MLKYVKLPIVPISNTKNMAWQLYELLISIFPEQFIYTEIEKAEKKISKISFTDILSFAYDLFIHTNVKGKLQPSKQLKFMQHFYS